MAALFQPPVVALVLDKRKDVDMTFNPDIHHRRSIRLKGYDYSQAGAYFITICTKNRECMFGDILDGKMVLNHAGDMIQTVWDEIPLYYAGIDIDEFAVMPNHIHGIIVIVGATPCGCPVSTPCGCRSITGQTLENGRGPGYWRGKEQKFGQARGQGQPQGVAPTMTMVQ